MSKEEISVNVSTCKKFLMKSGHRVSFDAIKVFQVGLAKIADQITANAKVLADQKGKKTILPEYVEKALESVTVEVAPAVENSEQVQESQE